MARVAEGAAAAQSVSDPETATPSVQVRPHLPARPISPVARAPLGSNELPAGEYREVAVAQISPSPFQPRRHFAEEQLAELAESIRSEGLLQPIVVRSLDEGRYELIAGERRWRAHQVLGVQRIMARVMRASDASSAVLALIENLQREGLNPIEEALGFASLMSDFDLTQEAVAERVGRARASVANSLRLLQLDREIQGYLAKGVLTAGHAKVLLGVADVGVRSLLARRSLEQGLSVRELERLVKASRADRPTPAGSAESDMAGPRAGSTEEAVIASLEREISSRLNTSVQIKHTAKRGRLIIEYFGNADLQRILEKTGLQ